ncbi:MAG: hypothetical protein JWO51_2445 [Rhodospirillales bacterium]|nr:hypothetical protein [Rhodospirillales bacterium]
MPQFAFGGGALYAVRTDIANVTPTRFGALQDVQLDFSGDLKELHGQGQFALALARGKAKIEGKAKFAQINGALFNNLFFGQTLTTGQSLVAQSEAALVPVSAPFQVTAQNGASFATDLGVFYAQTGAPLAKVASAPALGQYAVAAGGLYSFAAADEGTALLLNYEYSATTGTRIALGNPLMGVTPTFQAIFSEQYAGKQLTLQLNACVASKLSFPTKQDDWSISELDFQAQTDPAGNVGFLSLSE